MADPDVKPIDPLENAPPGGIVGPVAPPLEFPATPPERRDPGRIHPNPEDTDDPEAPTGHAASASAIPAIPAPDIFRGGGRVMYRFPHAVAVGVILDQILNDGELLESVLDEAVQGVLGTILDDIVLNEEGTRVERVPRKINRTVTIGGYDVRVTSNPEGYEVIITAAEPAPEIDPELPPDDLPVDPTGPIVVPRDPANDPDYDPGPGRRTPIIIPLPEEDEPEVEIEEIELPEPEIQPWEDPGPIDEPEPEAVPGEEWTPRPYTAPPWKYPSHEPQGPWKDPVWPPKAFPDEIIYPEDNPEYENQPGWQTVEWYEVDVIFGPNWDPKPIDRDWETF